jgi:hypothetical protein
MGGESAGSANKNALDPEVVKGVEGCRAGRRGRAIRDARDKYKFVVDANRLVDLAPQASNSPGIVIPLPAADASSLEVIVKSTCEFFITGEISPTEASPKTSVIY